MSTTLLVIDAALVRELAPPSALIGWMRLAMQAVSAGEAELPLRRALPLPGGRGMLGMMPGYLAPARAAGIKLVSLVPPECRKGSSHLGLMVLFDEDGLVPLALLCGATITALRTAAATALATDELARRDAHVLALLGTGEQAEAHLRALPLVRPFDEVRVWSRTHAKAQAFVAAQTDAARLGKDGQAAPLLRACASAQEAVAGADVICTLTASAAPILQGAWLSPGQHVNLVGSSVATASEADDAVVARSRYFVDWRESALNQAGELLGAIERGVVTPAHIQAEIGEVLAGRVSGRRADDEITLYKSLGIAAQDLMTARCVFDLARARGLGTTVTV